MFGAAWRGVLASLPVLRAAGHGFDPDGAVCCAGGERPAGMSVWGLLWRGQYHMMSPVELICVNKSII